jgi:hypothetical protein
MSTKRHGIISEIESAQEHRNSCKRRREDGVDLTPSHGSHVSATKQPETFADIQGKAFGCDSLRSTEGKLRIH